MFSLIFILATIGQIEGKHDHVPPLVINEGERVGRDHPLHHPHDTHVDHHEDNSKPHIPNIHPVKPEAQKYHPVRKLFRGGVEFVCGMLGIPGMFVKFVGYIELFGLICVLTFFAAIVLGFGYVGLRVLGVVK